MSMTSQRSVEEIRRDSEHTRAVLIETVDQLRTKASDMRERLSPERLIERARENPLQAVAIGAGIAYPLLAVARSIPAPVLMIGAGLFLMGSKSGQSLTQGVADQAARAADRLSEGAEAVRRSAHDARDFAAGQISRAGEVFSSGADATTQKASETADAVKAQAGALATQSAEAAETARESATNAAANVRSGLAAAARTGGEAAERAASMAADTMQRHPLVVGGIGLAVGALIASCLPRSDVEEGLMGGASAAVQDRAKDVAARGVETAKEVAAAAYSGAAKRAQDEGLTPEGVHEAAQDLGEKMRKVADSATNAAFGTAGERAPGDR